MKEEVMVKTRVKAKRMMMMKRVLVTVMEVIIVITMMGR